MNDGAEKHEAGGRPDSFWRRIYIAVVATTFVVITFLWAFSKYFS